MNNIAVLAGCFSDYSFKFNSNNTISIHNTDKTYSGKWLVFSNEGTDDQPPVDVDFSIFFNKSALNKLLF